jgi:hypothetical protein
MTRQELKDKLTGKSFFFNNQLVKQLGGSKKGSKSQDIEEILEFYDADNDKVVSAFEALEATKANRFAKIKNALSEVRESWETLVSYVHENENIPENIQAIIEKIDDVVDFIFGEK